MYVPQGTSVGAINVTTSSAATGTYEPNQFVMNCGIADPTAGPIRPGSPIARNLNDGDAIALVVSTPTQQQEVLWEHADMLSLSTS